MLPKPYYQDEFATLYCGDCREILPLLPNVDLILTDPPYGVGLGKKVNNKRFDRQSYTQVEDTPDFISQIVIPVIETCRQIAWRVIVTPGVKNMFSYPSPTHVGSFYYPAASGCNSWGFSCWQPILYYGKDPYGGKGSKPDSFMSTEAADKNGHPCPKPLGQWKMLLKRCSLPGEIVLDPFAGSGTTLVAAKQLGMRSIGIEISPEYCAIAANRLKDPPMIEMIVKAEQQALTGMED